MSNDFPGTFDPNYAPSFGRLILFGYPCDLHGCDLSYCGFLFGINDQELVVSRPPLVLPCNIRSIKRNPCSFWDNIAHIFETCPLEHIPQTNFERTNLIILDISTFKEI